MRVCSVEGCGNKHKGLGYCKKHYHALKRLGDPLAGRTFEKRGHVRNWVLNNLLFCKDECLIWPFRSKQNFGYAVWTVEGKTTYVHSFYCEQVNGPRPDGMVTRHTCGNGHLGCVNPKHLMWGTSQENSDDRIKHGTHLEDVNAANARLTSEQVLEIYDLSWSGAYQKDVAKIFDIEQTTVSQIKRKKIYKQTLKARP